MKYNEKVKAVKLNVDRQRLRRMLTLIVSNNMFMKFKYNYYTDKQKRDHELLSRRASLKIYMKMARFIHKHGENFKFRVNNSTRKEFTFFGNFHLGYMSLDLWALTTFRLRSPYVTPKNQRNT